MIATNGVLTLADLDYWETTHTWACMQPEERHVGMAGAVQWSPMTTCFKDLFPEYRWIVHWNAVYMDGAFLFRPPYWMVRTIHLCDAYPGMLIDIRAFRRILQEVR